MKIILKNHIILSAQGFLHADLIFERESAMRRMLKAVESQDCLTGPHALQACWEGQLDGLGADAVCVALECGLFSHLQAFTTAETLAAQLPLDAANTGYLLELLWGMNLLERETMHGSRPSSWRNLQCGFLLNCRWIWKDGHAGYA